MTDREVVITHLDDLRLFADVTVHPVVSPGNWDVYSSLCDYIDQIKTEVEILLKEQEPVEPEVEVLNEIDRLYRCPKCHKCFFYEKQKYCDQCGQAVKWNE